MASARRRKKGEISGKRGSSATHTLPGGGERPKRDPGRPRGERAARRRPLRRWAIAGLALAGVGALIRVGNALRYPLNWGFDAIWNWEYITLLMQSWTLPSPDTGWSMAHPPLFYVLAAAIGRALDHPHAAVTIYAVRLASAAMGLLTVGLAVVLVRRVDPENPRRALLAAGLLLFLPVHIYMSATLTEELMVSFLISVAMVGVASDMLRPRVGDRALTRAAGLGVFAGLALLTKLTGLVVIVAAVGAYLIEGRRRNELAPALYRALVFVATASAVGGWFYLRNWVQYGYLYPHGLEVHSLMFTMPPGFRGVGDYLRIPWETFGRANLLSPEMLHSVWGATYVTVWFDGHRIFLPRDSVAVTRMGSAILLLGLLPTVAFLLGLTRGIRRVIRSAGGPDTTLLLLVAVTLTGYVAFTWRNPVFATVKGSFLLCLSVPFAYYGSEILADWTRSRGVRSIALCACLCLLALLSAATFSFGTVFHKTEGPGIEWTLLETPWHE